MRLCGRAKWNEWPGAVPAAHCLAKLPCQPACLALRRGLKVFAAIHAGAQPRCPLQAWPLDLPCTTYGVSSSRCCRDLRLQCLAQYPVLTGRHEGKTPIDYMTDEEVMELHDAIIKQDEELRKQVILSTSVIVGAGTACACASLALCLADMHSALVFQPCVPMSGMLPVPAHCMRHQCTRQLSLRMQSCYTRMLACMPLTVVGSWSHALPRSALSPVVGAVSFAFINHVHSLW